MFDKCTIMKKLEVFDLALYRREPCHLLRQALCLHAIYKSLLPNRAEDMGVAKMVISEGWAGNNRNG
jgi:hypothetical protein